MAPRGSRNLKDIAQLSKSRFLAGIQCHKRLYLECYARHLADPVSDSQQAIFNRGTRIGAAARQRYPGGVLIEEDHLHHREAVASTDAVLADPSVPAIFEAAFTCDEIRIRADILARSGDGRFDLIEVKSSYAAREEHKLDIAIQLYVLEELGLPVRHACLLHLSRSGTRRKAGVFRLADLTAEARNMRPSLIEALTAMRWVLLFPKPPLMPTGKHCISPYICEFMGHCHQNG